MAKITLKLLPLSPTKLLSTSSWILFLFWWKVNHYSAGLIYFLINNTFILSKLSCSIATLVSSFYAYVRRIFLIGSIAHLWQKYHFHRLAAQLSCATILPMEFYIYLYKNFCVLIGRFACAVIIRTPPLWFKNPQCVKRLVT